MVPGTMPVLHRCLAWPSADWTINQGNKSCRIKHDRPIPDDNDESPATFTKVLPATTRTVIVRRPINPGRKSRLKGTFTKVGHKPIWAETLEYCVPTDDWINSTSCKPEPIPIHSMIDTVSPSSPLGLWTPQRSTASTVPARLRQIPRLDKGYDQWVVGFQHIDFGKNTGNHRRALMVGDR